MKKILMAIALIACLVLPLSAMAMSTVADNELSAITGQAGVSINVDITAELNIGTIAWGDSDGFAGAVGAAPAGYFANAGFVGITGLDLTFHMSGRHDGVFADTTTQGMGYLLNKPITIDVGSNSTDTKTLVRFGIPTSHIIVSTLDLNVFVSGAAAGAPTSTSAQQLGEMYIGGMEITLGQNPTGVDAAGYDAGYVTIGAAGAGNTGVSIGFNIKIDKIAIGTISWGNTTNLVSVAGGGSVPTSATSAGFIGITGLNIGNVTIAGGVAIGIGTIDGSLLGAAAFGKHAMVNIAFADNTTIAIPGAIMGTVVLAGDKTLTTNAQELGNFYLGQMVLTIKANTTDAGNSIVSPHSLVQIWAH